jgi:hypothetical protein
MRMICFTRFILGASIAFGSLASACTADDASCGGTLAPVDTPIASQAQDASAQDFGSEQPASERDAATDGSVASNASSNEDAGATSDGGAPGCLEATIRWSSPWSSPIATMLSRVLYVTPCRTFIVESAWTLDEDGGVPLCENELPIDRGITADSINARLAHPDVQAALAQAPAVYGTSSSPLDTTPVLLIDVGGATLQVGDPCSSDAVDCNAVPPGVAALAAVVYDLAEQQEQLPDCELTN